MDIREVDKDLSVDGREIAEARKLPGMKEYSSGYAKNLARDFFARRPIQIETLQEIVKAIEAAMVQGFVLGREFKVEGPAPMPTPPTAIGASRIETLRVDHGKKISEIMNEI